MRVCEQCGASMEQRRNIARFCSAVCRSRHARKVPPRPAAVVQMLPERTEGPDEPLIGLEQVARELQRELRRRETPASAKAALAKEYRATLAEIERVKPAEADAIDELLARRMARASS